MNNYNGKCNINALVDVVFERNRVVSNFLINTLHFNVACKNNEVSTFRLSLVTDSRTGNSEFYFEFVHPRERRMCFATNCGNISNGFDIFDLEMLVLQDDASNNKKKGLFNSWIDNSKQDIPFISDVYESKDVEICQYIDNNKDFYIKNTKKNIIDEYISNNKTISANVIDEFENLIEQNISKNEKSEKFYDFFWNKIGIMYTDVLNNNINIWQQEICSCFNVQYTTVSQMLDLIFSQNENGFFYGFLDINFANFLRDMLKNILNANLKKLQNNDIIYSVEMLNSLIIGLNLMIKFNLIRNISIGNDLINGSSNSDFQSLNFKKYLDKYLKSQLEVEHRKCLDLRDGKSYKGKYNILDEDFKNIPEYEIIYSPKYFMNDCSRMELNISKYKNNIKPIVLYEQYSDLLKNECDLKFTIDLSKNYLKQYFENSVFSKKEEQSQLDVLEKIKLLDEKANYFSYLNLDFYYFYNDKKIKFSGTLGKDSTIYTEDNINNKLQISLLLNLQKALFLFEDLQWKPVNFSVDKLSKSDDFDLTKKIPLGVIEFLEDLISNKVSVGDLYNIKISSLNKITELKYQKSIELYIKMLFCVTFDYSGIFKNEEEEFNLSTTTLSTFPTKKILTNLKNYNCDDCDYSKLQEFVNKLNW